MSDPRWDDFMDRVIAAQRDIARNGGAPYRYTIYVHPNHYAQLLPHLTSTALPIEQDATVTEGVIVLRHEVQA